MTPEDLIAFETDIAEVFNAGKIHAPVHLYYGNEAQMIEVFDVIDRELYPTEFVGGIYELDEIEFVRVSPMDAKKGLSKRPGPDKVAGDKLAHFSAFLRRDWRSNDILQGRVDGACLIIESLLTDEALERALRS